MKEWEKNIRKAVPYVPGEQPREKGIIKINTNENPYPPAPAVEKILREYQTDSLKLYPEPDAGPLVEGLAEYLHLRPEQIFPGVGSDDVLAMAFLTFFHGEEPILFPDITYSFYKVWASLFGIAYRTPALDAGFRIKKEDYYAKNGGIIFANPNAPTGLHEPLAFIEDILKHNQDSVVIVDEAYVDFGGDTALPLLDQYENLLVVQTYSKSRSMAGMRIGYAAGGRRLIAALNSVKHSFNSYTLNKLSIACGAAALQEEAYFRRTIEQIIRTRECFRKTLLELGFSCTDSKANFIFARHPDADAEALLHYLKGCSIYVRHFNMPKIDQYLRITIGTDAEMELAASALRRYFQK